MAILSEDIIFDPDRRKLSGIIDWSDAKIADPAMDFSGLFSISERLGDRALDSSGKEGSDMRKRAILYLRTIPLREIAWGVEVSSKRIIQLELSDFYRWSIA
jgi:aminoglycoside phosphotransferase (APT) family kinase protein